MNLRCTVLAALVSLGLGVSTARAQAWSVTELRGEEPFVPAIRSYAPATVSYGPTVISGSVYPSAAYPGSGYAANSAPNYAFYSAPSYPAYSAPNYAVYSAPNYAAYAGPSYAAPAISYRPVVAAYATPAVAYRPAVASCAGPYTAYSPTAVTAYSASAYSVPVSVPPGKRVIVHPKVYVEGQPIRNLIKAITP